MADFTKIIGINLDDLVKIDGISADSIEKVNGLTPDDGGGGGGSGIEQHGAFVVLQGAQNQSYLNQVVASPAANNTYIYEDEGGGIFRIRRRTLPRKRIRIPLPNSLPLHFLEHESHSWSGTPV